MNTLITEVESLLTDLAHTVSQNEYTGLAAVLAAQRRFASAFPRKGRLEPVDAQWDILRTQAAFKAALSHKGGQHAGF